jgi:hypothetical protein
MLFKGMISVNFNNHVKHANTLCGQTPELLDG